MPTPLSLSSLSLREAVVVLSVSSLEDPRLNIRMLPSPLQHRSHYFQPCQYLNRKGQRDCSEDICPASLCILVFGFKPLSGFAGTPSLSSFQLSSPGGTWPARLVVYLVITSIIQERDTPWRVQLFQLLLQHFSLSQPGFSCFHPSQAVS